MLIKKYIPDKWLLIARLCIFFLLIISSSSCNLSKTIIQPTQTITPTTKPEITDTPALQPLGTGKNPIIQGLVAPDENPSIQEAGDVLAKDLSNITGYTIKTQYFNNYKTLLENMELGIVHTAWLQPLSYISAEEKGYARAVLLTNNLGVFEYGTQFLANADSGFTVYFDPSKNTNLVDASTALTQFTGKHPCWVDKDSPSGYILPAGILAQNNVDVPQGAFLISHSAVVRSLYIRGVCDFGVTFALSGDPRTSSNLQDLPDVINRIPVIWKSDALIPTLNFSVLPEIPEDMRNNLINAYLQIVNTPEGKQVLSTASNYDIQDLKMINDEIYNPLKDSIKALGIDPATLPGK